MPKTSRVVTVAVGLALAGCSQGRSSGAVDTALAPVPESVAGLVQLVRVSEADEPLDLVAPPDSSDRLFVVEKGGRIRILRGGAVEQAPFLDLSSEVSTGSEQGLLGLAFHPQFGSNGRFFVNYTDRNGDSRIVEYAASPPAADVADPAPRRELLFLDQPYANHNGGDLEFDADGLLLVGTGDGGSANDPEGRAQDPGSLFGKMLRLDVEAPSPQPQIVARGLRNPWRYAFDAATGDLFIADVGQSAWEEVNFVAGGRLDGPNFGWDRMEGGHCVGGDCDTSGLVLPVTEYEHPTGCSITGGRVYRGQALPEIAGHYFYSDFCSALLRSVRMENGVVAAHWDWKAALDPDDQLTSISAFGSDRAGELYLLSLDGPIWKLVRAPGASVP